jgi:hypothetical protein
VSQGAAAEVVVEGRPELSLSAAEREALAELLAKLLVQALAGAAGAER